LHNASPFQARPQALFAVSLGNNRVMISGVESICVVIGRTRHKMVQTEIQEAAKAGARLIELRLDFLAKAPDFKRLLANKPCPIIATARRPQDGGRWGRDETDRRMLLRQAVVAGFDWVDLETEIADEIRRFKNVKRIVSYHNLEGVPDDLEQIYEQLCKQDPDVVKIAVTAQHPTDNMRVLKLLHKPPVPTVAFCMGEMGIPSRLLGAKLGAPFTYAAFNKERGIAPGIPSFEELLEIYHYDQINADTEVFGVIGDPVGHSLSPLIHNTAFHHLGLNAVYVPFRVPRGHLPGMLKSFESLPVRGYSITIPHNEGAAAYAKDQDQSVKLIRAANSLVWGEDGFKAWNTDYEAALESLRNNMPAGPDGVPSPVQGRAVLVLGAGGAARAIAHALQRSGATVTISNRTIDRARDLATEVDCRYADWGARHNVTADVLVNCTPVGMYPKMDESPIHPSFLTPGLIVMDCVYTPETTLLVKEARSRGCHVITGVDMFVRQAAYQFRLFTGQEPPFDLMQTVVKRALSPVAIRDEA
jgi:3-dehydroquinate dehydratase/shikimate dehydrogenase